MMALPLLIMATRPRLTTRWHGIHGWGLASGRGWRTITTRWLRSRCAIALSMLAMMTLLIGIIRLIRLLRRGCGLSRRRLPRNRHRRLT
jgi:hypothetical protein